MVNIWRYMEILAQKAGEKIMAGRPRKLTKNPSDRKDQRDATQKLIDENNSEPSIAAKAPKYLKSYARSMYNNLAPILSQKGYITQSEQAILESFCVTFQMLRVAYEDVNKNGQSRAAYRTVVDQNSGDVIAHDFTGFKRNPSTQIIDSATSRLISLGQQLGLTPVSRATFANLNADKDDGFSVSDLAQMFGGE